MSLDVYLEMPGVTSKGTGIYVREKGTTREITRAEWDAKFPGCEPIMLADESNIDHSVYSRNITHNLNKMADAAGLYYALWRPDELKIERAEELIVLLRAGLKALRADPARFTPFEPSNGWGSYAGLVDFVADYLAACERWPMAAVRVSR